MTSSGGPSFTTLKETVGHPGPLSVPAYDVDPYTFVLVLDGSGIGEGDDSCLAWTVTAETSLHLYPCRR